MSIKIPEGEDPPTNYITIEDEMVKHAPIRTMNPNGMIMYDPMFQINNSKTFNKLAQWACEHTCWTYLKLFAKTHNSHKAWLTLIGHFLGPSNIDNADGKAEVMLHSLTYNGETHCWNFDLYVNKHLQQHTFYQNCTDFGYAGIDICSKVCYLCDGKKVPALDMVKMRIMSDEALCVDFSRCVTLFSDFIKQKQLTEGLPT